MLIQHHLAVSRRGVVFFRHQEISPDEQKQLTDRIGQLAGKPKSSTLHIHPVINSERDAEFQAVDKNGTANKDDTISVISSKGRKAIYERSKDVRIKNGADEWHSGELAVLQSYRTFELTRSCRYHL